MSYQEECFRILDIEKTTDKHLIKKAYANKVKYCHPEDEPQRWEQLHDAYESAMRYATGESVIVPIKLKKPEREQYVEDDLNELYEELEAHCEQQKENMEALYRQKFAGLEKCSRQESDRKWKELFEDPYYSYYCHLDGFWTQLSDVLGRAGVKAGTRSYILRKLSEAEAMYANGSELKKLSEISRAKQICYEKDWYYWIGQNSKKKVLIFIGFFLVVFYAMIIAMQVSGEMAVTEEIAKNLNKKYGTIYSLADFKIKEITESAVNTYDGNLKIYKAWLRNNEECVVYYFTYQEDGSQEKILQMDNFQCEEIESGLQEELVTALGVNKGMAYLCSAEPLFFANLLPCRSETIYGAKYDGDIKKFFEEETKLRSEWVEIDEESFENMNGRCAFWFPDCNVADMEQFIENPQCSYEKPYFDAVKEIEDAYHIQILAAAFPQSYYNNLEQVLCDKEREDKEYLERHGEISEIELPLGMPFVTTWYQTSDEEAAVEIHSNSAQKLKDGIYLMNREESEDIKVYINTEKKNKQITIQVNDDNKDLTDFILVLDMKKWGIDENNYYAIGESKNFEVNYYNIPYTSAGWERGIWCGEDYLYIPCRKNNKDSATVSVFLEKENKE